MGGANCCYENRQEHKTGVNEKDNLTVCNINDQTRYINTNNINTNDIEDKTCCNDLNIRKRPNIELEITKK